MTDAGDAVPTSAVALHVGPAGAADRYELTAERSGGAEGILYQARFRAPDAGLLVVAIKALRLGDAAPEVESWLANRAVLRTLHHPNVVRYLDHFVGAPPHRVGTAAPDDGSIYYEVMEWVDGSTLDQLVRSRSPAPVERWPFVEQLAAAVDYLHDGRSAGANPIVHRDIKPANVIVHPTRGAVLVDFGLARVERAQTDHQAAGTEGYRAPELVHDGAPPSRESDRWSVAATAHFALTGQAPSIASPSLVAAATAEVGSSDAAAVGAAFAVALDPDPALRPTRLEDWALATGRALAPRPVDVARPIWRRPVAVGAAAMVALGGVVGVARLASGGGDDRVAPTTAATRPTSVSTIARTSTTRRSTTSAASTSVAPSVAPTSAASAASTTVAAAACRTDAAKSSMVNGDGKTRNVQQCDLRSAGVEVRSLPKGDAPVIGRVALATNVYFFCKMTADSQDLTTPSGALVRTNIWARTQLPPEAAGTPVAVDGWVSATVFISPIDSLRWCGSTEKAAI